MRTIYNEGRVVGLSAYEMYVRAQLAEGVDPSEIKSESEWSAAVMTDARGGAMLLKIAAGTPAGVKSYVLPEGTSICPDGPLYATLFEGTPTSLINNMWATHVESNGRLISNTEESSPLTPGDPVNVPTAADPEIMTDLYRSQCIEYMKINSGIAIQPGEWVESGVEAPYKSLKPNLSAPAFIRLAFSSEIQVDFHILITGFMSIESLSDMVQSEDYSQDYLSGQCFGPLVFPWANKVQLLMTTDSLKGYLDWYLDATLTTAEYQELPVKEEKFYFTRKQ